MPTIGFEAPRVLGTEGGAGAGFSVNGGWGEAVGLSAGDLEADLPAEGFEVPRVLGAEGGGNDGWGMVMGLSAGELTAEDEALSKVSIPRPARGKGANPPASGESQAHLLPLWTFEPDPFACLMRNSRSSASEYVRRSVLPVEGFWGIRLHPSFFDLHRLHGPLVKRRKPPVCPRTDGTVIPVRLE